MLEKKDTQKEVDDLNKTISEMEAENNRNKIMENFKCYSDNPENINLSEMWKTLRKLWPKNEKQFPSS